jgi:hypothetical protein
VTPPFQIDRDRHDLSPPFVSTSFFDFHGTNSPVPDKNCSGPDSLFDFFFQRVVLEFDPVWANLQLPRDNIFLGNGALVQTLFDVLQLS